MEFPERLSERITKTIADNVQGFSEEKLEQINYGIAVFITNSYKILLLFVAAYFLKVFDSFLIAFLSFGFTRTFASGIHAKREWTCLPASALLFFGIVYGSKAIVFNDISKLLLYALCLMIFIRYSPADTEERPIRSKKLRKRLKLQSCLALTLLYLLSIFALKGAISSIIILTTIVESILILPVTYSTAKLLSLAAIKKI